MGPAHGSVFTPQQKWLWMVWPCCRYDICLPEASHLLLLFRSVRQPERTQFMSNMSWQQVGKSNHWPVYRFWFRLQVPSWLVKSLFHFINCLFNDKFREEDCSDVCAITWWTWADGDLHIKMHHYHFDPYKELLQEQECFEGREPKLLNSCSKMEAFLKMFLANVDVILKKSIMFQWK